MSEDHMTHDISAKGFVEVACRLVRCRPCSLGLACSVSPALPDV
jgi:hypothetical protein